MIKSFRFKVAKDLFNGINSLYSRTIPHELHNKIWKLFDKLNAAVKVDDLNSPPGNRL